MQLSHRPHAVSAGFDDPTLVSAAGLVPVAGRSVAQQPAQGQADHPDSNRYTPAAITIRSAPGAEIDTLRCLPDSND